MSRTKLIIITILANIFEWYDYTLFGNFADVIGINFFSYSDPESSILNVLLVFAVGYILRPIGGIFFGLMGDRVGRRNAFALSVILMGLPTFIIGLLPSYEVLGIWSSIIVVILRIFQGISMGGVLTTSICFTVEHTNPKYQNFFSSISMASLCAGILLGSFSAYIARTILSERDFLNWGWRIPFLMSVIAIFIGLYIKKYAEETQVFKDLGNDTDTDIKQKNLSLWQIIIFNWRTMLASIFINATGSIIFYLQAVYISNYLKFGGMSAAIVDKNASLSYLIMIPVALISG
ncbi:MAG: MFS transporter [Rickettsiaceae bacterium]|nr:MFS transporter [Rickettsiaceae bacterium]